MTSDVTPIVLFWVLLLVTLLAGTVSGTIRVVDDDWAGADFQTIGAAVNASSDGDLILVYAGVYGEHVRVNVLVEIVGNGSALTVVDGGGTGTVFEVDADGVRISGLRITGSGSQWSDAGVAISGDDDLMVDNCTFDGHLNAGVLVTQADGCSVVDSTFTECTTHGIQIRSATSTRMANLTFEGGAILISGSSRDEYVTHTVENCTVDGRPLFFAVGGEAVVVPQDSGAVIVIDCEHVLVRGLTLTGSNVGVLAAYSDSVNVEDTVIEDQRYGIQTWQSTNTSIDNCTILNCTIFGIDLSPGSDRTEIADTTVRDCRYGVRALSADDLRIRRSAIGPCTSYGLFLDSDSDRPRIEDTTIDGCQIGIFGKWWSGGRLKNCTVRDSTGVGIDLTEVGGLLVMGCHIANNTGGGLRSTNSTISVEDTVVTANGGTGVVLWGNDSVIDGGVISDNGADGAVLSGRGCAARNTTFEGNDGSGVMMTGDGHEVWRCTVRSNGRGIVLRSYTTNCSATQNVVEENTNYGLSVEFHCTNYLIARNRFIDNGGVGAQGFDASGNVSWDDGERGNYWSDLNGTDEDQDGIWDDPYPLDGPGDAVDRYPIVGELPTLRFSIHLDSDPPLDGETVQVLIGIVVDHDLGNVTVSVYVDDMLLGRTTQAITEGSHVIEFEWVATRGDHAFRATLTGAESAEATLETTVVERGHSDYIVKLVPDVVLGLGAFLLAFFIVFNLRKYIYRVLRHEHER